MSTFPANFELFLEEIKKREPVQKSEQNFIHSLRIANENPERLYRFFQMYNYLNAQIASTIAALVANIGKSREAFIDNTITVKDEADFSFEVADLVQEASIDEYADPTFLDQNGSGVSHRLLATGLLKAIGDYAKLSDEERNSMEIPEWLKRLTLDIQKSYSGKINDLEELSSAMGTHIFSEWSADNIEFSNAARELFIKGKDKGFHAYLQNNPKITVQGRTFLAHSWLKTHGGYDEQTNSIVHGVEYEHLETGYKALKLTVDKTGGAIQKDIITQNAFNGISKCHALLNTFFTKAKEQCVLDYPNTPEKKINPNLPTMDFNS